MHLLECHAAGKADGNVRDPPPEFWDQVNASPPGGAHLREHPILLWTGTDKEIAARIFAGSPKSRPTWRTADTSQS
jgi:hypothetical protein